MHANLDEDELLIPYCFDSQIRGPKHGQLLTQIDMENCYVWVLEYQQECKLPLGSFMCTISLKAFKTKETALLHAGWHEKDYVRKGYGISTEIEDETELAKAFRKPGNYAHGYRLRKERLI